MALYLRQIFSKQILKIPSVSQRVGVRMQGVSARQRACIEEERGLSELVFLCLGMSLDKTYQLSDWERRPLSEEQLLYAGWFIFVEILFHFEK